MSEARTEDVAIFERFEGFHTEDSDISFGGDLVGVAPPPTFDANYEATFPVGPLAAGGEREHTVCFASRLVLGVVATNDVDILIRCAQAGEALFTIETIVLLSGSTGIVRDIFWPQVSYNIVDTSFAGNVITRSCLRIFPLPRGV